MQSASPSCNYPIMLVEDDETDIEAAQRALKKVNVRNPVYVANDGIEALELLEGGELSRPCVMLLDINMPRMNGLELLRRMRENNKLRRNIAFVVTTSGREEDKAAAYDLHAAGYFLKENLEQFMEMLAAYCKAVEAP